MDQLIEQLNQLNIKETISDESVDFLCDTITKISLDDKIEISKEQIAQVSKQNGTGRQSCNALVQQAIFL